MFGHSVFAECKASQLKCKNSRCKPRFWQCDGRDDCGDNTDERNCGSQNSCFTSGLVEGAASLRTCSLSSLSTVVACRPGEFSCRNGRCVPEKLRCNGRDDCKDGSDESRCEKCKTSGHFSVLTSPWQHFLKSSVIDCFGAENPVKK